MENVAADFSKSLAHCTSRNDRRVCRWDRRSTSSRFQKTRLIQRRLLLRHRSVPGWDAREEIADCGLRIADLFLYLRERTNCTCSTSGRAKAIELREQRGAVRNSQSAKNSIAEASRLMATPEPVARMRGNRSRGLEVFPLPVAHGPALIRCDRVCFQDRVTRREWPTILH